MPQSKAQIQQAQEARDQSGSPALTHQMHDPKPVLGADWQWTTETGTALVDWFAGMALIGLVPPAVQIQDYAEERGDTRDAADVVSGFAYDYADGMMARKRKREENEGI